MLAQDKFQHLHRLHGEIRGALEALLQFCTLVCQISLLLVRILERLAYLAHLVFKLLDLLRELRDLGVRLTADTVQVDLNRRLVALDFL